MKKKLSPIMLFFMIFTLAGCGNQAAQTSVSDSTSQASASTEEKEIKDTSQEDDDSLAGSSISESSTSEIEILENADDARPALATHVENMEQYDTVYLGYPNWWYATPMAVLSFIDEYDFEGKQIVLFCSHGTGGLAGSVEAITEELPENCSISDNVLGVYRPEVAESKDRVLTWLEEIETELA